MSLIYGNITIDFPEREIFDDTVQLSLNINWSGGSDEETYDAEDLSLSVKSHGNLQLQYELDEYLLTPADINIVLNDPTAILADYLFGTDFNQMTVKAEIKINGTAEFNGTLIDDSLTYNDGSMLLSMGFSSDSNKINEVTLYDADDVAKNPLSLGLENYNSITNNEADSLTRIDLMLEKIFQLVDEDIETTITHNWVWGGITPTNRGWTFNNIYIENKSWFDNPNNNRLLGDLLKNVAKTFFAQIAIISNAKAIFRKLYYYSASNLQTVTVLNRVRNYKYHKIKYANSKNTFGTVDGAIIYNQPNEAAYTEVQGDYVSYSHIWDAYYVLKATAVDYEYVYYISDPLYIGEVQTYYTWQELISKLMYYYRSKTYFNRVDAFKLQGIGYDYTKNFIYDGSKYQILSMTKYLAEGSTDIEALYLGEA